MALQIDALPTPPSTSSPSTFDSLADAFIAALPDFVTQTNAVAVEVETTASGLAAGDTSLTARVSTEEVTRAAADTSLTSRVSTETVDRAAADTSIVSRFSTVDASLESRVSTEETARAAADTSLQSRFSTADVSLATVDGSLSTRISTEEGARSTADTSLNSKIDNLIASADAMVFKGVIDCSANPNYPAADAGWTYKVSVAGKIGGASGDDVEVGDVLICAVDATSAGTKAAVGANWTIIQANINWNAAEASINSRVSTEEAARASADTSLTSRLSGEEVARAAGDSSLQSRFSTADVSLATADASLQSRFSTADVSLATADSSIVTRFSTADASLTTRVSTVELSAAFSNTTATSAPTVNDDSGDGYSVGSSWFWPATGRKWECLDASVGAAVWTPIGVQSMPQYASGSYYAPKVVTRSNSAVAADTLYAVLIEIRERVTVSELVVMPTLGVGASTVLLGIYANSVNVPGALIAQGSGSASTASSGTAAIVTFSSNPVLTPGAYWLVSLFSATPTCASVATQNSPLSSVIGSPTLSEVLGTSATNTISGYSAAQAYASGLPSSFPTPTVRIALTTPLVAWKAA